MKEIRVGTENERDCLVLIREGRGLSINVDTKVSICRDDVVNLVKERIKKYGVKDAEIYIKEFGALDYVIKARLDYALYRFTGRRLKEKDCKRKETSRDRLRRSRLYVP